MADSKRNGSSENFDLDEVLGFAEKIDAVLLSGEPGIGKSTSFEMIRLKLKRKHPNRWIVFVELNKHHKAFQAVKNFRNFKTCEDAINFFERKILEIYDFEAQIFKKLFITGRVVILLDGLDEICPSYKNFIFDLMFAIHKLSNNQLSTSAFRARIGKSSTSDRVQVERFFKI